MIKVANCPCSLDDFLALDFFEENTQGPLLAIAAQALGVNPACVKGVRVLRRSVDARKRSNVHYVFMLAVRLEDEDLERRLVEQEKAQWYKPYQALSIPRVHHAQRPFVVGSGPAGLFAALYLAKAGLRPILVERGASVHERVAAIQAFNEGAELDLRTNVQFGEGGAGTFSDGKLTTGTRHPMAPHVLQWFLEAGAPQDIALDAKPHIGSDVLPDVVECLREQVRQAGGEVLFKTLLCDMKFEDGALSAVELEDAEGQRTWVPAQRLILACGHSARDTFDMLYGHGLRMEQKPFSMGVRIEHLQRDLDESQYGAFADHPALRASEYKMAVHIDDKRSAYTFCMCPGGQVVCASSEAEGVVTNGMSLHARDGVNSNAALLVNVDPKDFGGNHPLDGVRLQRQVERAAFECAAQAGGKTFAAPAQTVGDFLAGKSGHPSKRVSPSYPRGVAWLDLHQVLPPFVSHTLEQALPRFERKLHGFADPHAVMTGPETRSSSPVRICRNDGLQAYFASDDSKQGIGIYPSGEGPGFAGGIMSAASDGLRVACKLAEDMAAEDGFEEVLSALKAGHAAIFPTDTVYGLGVSVRHAASPEEIFTLKGRRPDKPIAWLVSSVDDLDIYGSQVPENVKRLARACWPGALTIIVKASKQVPESFLCGHSSIGLRMPASESALELIRELGCPLATSSANLSGEAAPSSLSDLTDTLKLKVACFADSAKPSGLASTVLDCSGDSVRILRAGDIGEATIQSFLQDYVPKGRI